MTMRYIQTQNLALTAERTTYNNLTYSNTLTMDIILLRKETYLNMFGIDYLHNINMERNECGGPETYNMTFHIVQFITRG